MASTHIGRKLYISSQPQTGGLTEASFKVLGWVEVTHVGQITEMGVRENIVNYDELETDVIQKSKGLTNAGDPTVEVARTAGDPGQVIMRAAGRSRKGSYAFKITDDDALPGYSPTTYYNLGVVSGPKRPNGRAEDFILEVYTLSLSQREIISVTSLIWTTYLKYEPDVLANVTVDAVAPPNLTSIADSSGNNRGGTTVTTAGPMYSEATATAVISGAVWSSTSGGQINFTVNHDYQASLAAGDRIEALGVVNSGGASTSAFVGRWTVVSVPDATHVIVAAPAAGTIGTYVSGGTFIGGGVNGRNSLLFDGTNGNGTITISNARGFGRGKAQIGATFVIRSRSFAAVNNFLQAFTSVANRARFSFTSQLTTGKLVVASRKNGSDTAHSFPSNLLMYQDVTHVGRVSVNTVTGEMKADLDDFSDAAPVTTNIAGTITPGWESGLGFIEDIDGIADAKFVPGSGSNFNGHLCYLHLWEGEQPYEDFLAERTGLISKWDTPFATLEIPTRNVGRYEQVWPRDVGGGADVLLPVDVKSGGDAVVHTRILNHVTRALVEDWTALGTTVAGTGLFIKNFPDGSFKVLYKKAGEIDASAVEGAEIIKVGEQGLATGQSNFVRWSSKGQASPYASSAFVVPLPVPATSVARHATRFSQTGHFAAFMKINDNQHGPGTGEAIIGPTSEDVGGNALLNFLMRMEALHGYPFEMLFFPWGGVNTDQFAGPGAAKYDGIIALLDGTPENPGPGNKFSFVMCLGAEDSALDDVQSQTVIEDTYIDQIVGFRDYTGNPNLPMYIATIGQIPVGVSTTDETCRKVVRAQENLENRDPLIKVVLHTGDHQPGVSDGAHFTVPQFITNSERAAYGIAFDRGLAGITANTDGPTMGAASIAVGTGTIIITVADLNGGAALVGKTGSTDLTGFNVTVTPSVGAPVVYDNVPANIVSGAVHLLPAGYVSVGTDTVTWAYQDRAVYSVTNPLYCNYAFGMETKAPLKRIVDQQPVTI